MTSRIPLVVLVLGLLLTLLAPQSAAATAAPGHPDPRPAPGAWVRFEVTTANVRSNPEMPQPRVQADYDRIRGLGGTAMFQEISPSRYKEALARTFADRRVEFLGRSPIPIALGTSWRVEARGLERMHGGLAGVSPHRSVAWLKVSRTSGGRTVRFVLMNTHYVSGAWNGRADRADAWRKARWNDHFREMGDLVRGFNARGLTVIGGGDFNRTIPRGLRKFTGKQRWLFSDGGVDKIFVAPADGGARVALKRTRSTRGHSDHAFRTAVLKIGPARR